MNLVEIQLLTANTYSFYDLSYVFKMVPLEFSDLAAFSQIRQFR